VQAVTARTKTPEHASKNFFTWSSQKDRFRKDRFPDRTGAYANSLDIRVKGYRAGLLVPRSFKLFSRSNAAFAGMVAVRRASVSSAERSPTLDWQRFDRAISVD
jgi:hypothetical protein